MKRLTEKRINVRKLIQIIAVYAFALMAAVACGDSFAPKDLNGGAFGIARALRAATPDGGVQIEYIVADRGQGATLTLPHGPGQLEAAQTGKIGSILYQINDLCANPACTEVAVVLARVDQSTSNETVTQSAFYLQGEGQLLSIKVQRHGTHYDFATEAMNEMRATLN